MLNETTKIIYSQWQKGYVAKRITKIKNKFKNLKFYTLMIFLVKNFTKIFFFIINIIINKFCSRNNIYNRNNIINISDKVIYNIYSFDLITIKYILEKSRLIKNISKLSLIK